MREFFVYLMVVVPFWTIVWFITHYWQKDPDRKMMERKSSESEKDRKKKN